MKVIIVLIVLGQILGLWQDLPKEIYNGHEYAKIGKYYYSKHAVDYMVPKSLKAELNIPHEVRGVPPSVVENAIEHGSRIVSMKAGEARYLYTYGDVVVVTNYNSTVVISLGKRTK